jgi:hypothetical protein
MISHVVTFNTKYIEKHLTVTFNGVQTRPSILVEEHITHLHVHMYTHTRTYLHVRNCIVMSAIPT